MNCILGSCLSPDGCANMFCFGKEPCKCCYCMLGEEDQVGRVFDHFVPLPVSEAAKQPNGFNMFVGRVTLPDDPQRMGKQCMYSPGSNKACVYWRVIVSEEWLVWRRVDEYEGDGEERRKVGEHWECSTEWRGIVDQENYCDFYLQDGATKIFVNGSKRGDTRVQSEWDEGGDNWGFFSHTQLPQGIRWLADTHGTSFGGWGRTWFSGGRGHSSFHRPSMPTGEFRWKECCFEVNEPIACLGKASPAYQDPYTQTLAMALIPVMADAISEDEMKDAEISWSTWDIWSWLDMQKDDPDGAVLLSDKKKYTSEVQVGAPLDLPRWQTVCVPQYAPWGVDTDGDGFANYTQQVQVGVQQVTVAAPGLVAVDTNGDGIADTMVDPQQLQQQQMQQQAQQMQMGQMGMVAPTAQQMSGV